MHVVATLSGHMGNLLQRCYILGSEALDGLRSGPIHSIGTQACLAQPGPHATCKRQQQFSPQPKLGQSEVQHSQLLNSSASKLLSLKADTEDVYGHGQDSMTQDSSTAATAVLPSAEAGPV